MHCPTAWGQWAVEILQCTATQPGGSEWAVELLQCTATLPRGSGQWQPQTARAHRLGGREVLPSRWSLPMERLRGMAAPNGAGPLAGGGGKSCPVGGRCSRSARGEWQPPNGAGPMAGGTGSPAQSVVAAHGALAGDGSPQNGAGPLAGGREVLPSRWSLLKERLRGMAAPNGAGSLAGGTGCGVVWRGMVWCGAVRCVVGWRGLVGCGSKIGTENRVCTVLCVHNYDVPPLQ